MQEGQAHSHGHCHVGGWLPLLSKWKVARPLPEREGWGSRREALGQRRKGEMALWGSGRENGPESVAGMQASIKGPQEHSGVSFFILFSS